MKNAHLRVGRLSYHLIGEKRSTSISVILDRLVAEMSPETARERRAYLLSVLGTDAEIGAIAAALAKDAIFAVQTPDMDRMRVFMEAKPVCYRGTVVVPGRNRPLRHLIAVSQQWNNSDTSANLRQVLLLDSSPDFIWTNLAYIYGLPGRPGWAGWFHEKLLQERAIIPLSGIGCDPVLINGERDQYLSWLGQGVREGSLCFPSENGPILWPKFNLRDVLLPPEESNPPNTPRPA